MSFFSLPNKSLSQILAIANQISPRKSEVEVFTYLKVILNKDKISFYSASGSVFYSTNLEISSIENLESELSFLVKTEIFFSSVALLNDEMIAFELNQEKQTLVVQGSKSSHTLRIDIEKAPEFIEFSDDSDLAVSAVVESKTFLENVKSANISVGQPRNVFSPEFLNLCFTAINESSQLNIVATDRYRVTKTTMNADFKTFAVEEGKINFLIQPRAFQAIASAISEEKTLQIDFYGNSAVFNLQNGKFVIKYGSGNYPDYDKIIPQSFSCSFVLNTKDLQNGLKQVYLSAKSNTINKSLSISIEPQTKLMTISSQSEDGYASESKVDLKEYIGPTDTWKQSFNADFLLDYINTIQTEEVFWESNPGKPSVISPNGEKEKQLYLVIGLK